jgi:uracil phosphoribosyltransferase
MRHHRPSNKQPKLPRLHERLHLENRHDSDHETTSDSRTDSHATRQSTTPSFTRSSNTVELMLSPPTVDVAVIPESSWEAPSPVSNPSPREADGKRKRPRFLGDIDRRMIIQRLANGEKQADLAREFGVTRAAICHINKNRDEILTRFDILAKSPQGRQMIENYVRSPHFSSCVRELRTPSVAVLLTRLRDASVSPATFKSTADRLMSLLIEESLVSFGTRAVGVQDVSGVKYEGKEYARSAFALSLGETGRPLLAAFATMEPTAFRGLVVVEKVSQTPALRRLDLPQNAGDANVLLFQVALHDAELTGVAIEALQARGVAGSRICVVCVAASAAAITAFASRFQDVKVVTATINADVDAPRLQGFADKYECAA